MFVTYYAYIEKVNREVFALIGDVPQMAPVVADSPATFIKKQKNMKKTADKWVWN